MPTVELPYTCPVCFDALFVVWPRPHNIPAIRPCEYCQAGVVVSDDQAVALAADAGITVVDDAVVVDTNKLADQQSFIETISVSDQLLESVVSAQGDALPVSIDVQPVREPPIVRST